MDEEAVGKEKASRECIRMGKMRERKKRNSSGQRGRARRQEVRIVGRQRKITLESKGKNG